MLRHLERRVGADDAPDALAEVMVVVWRRAGELPDDDRARMWLFGIARHVVFNVDRSRQRRWALADRLRGEPGPLAAAPADEGAEVRDALARLAPDLAELVTLVHWDGFTLAEAAELLGLAPTTVRSRYARAKEQLRAALAPAAPVG